MTREEMIKRSWKPYMKVLYQHPRMDEAVECMLIAIHFDNETVEISQYDEESFTTSLQTITIPKKITKLKAV